jgi:hypothetical protein
MSYHGDFALESTFDVKFTTGVNGIPTVLAGSPVISAYIGNGTTQITAGITLTADFDGVVGLNNVRVVATAGNGYAAGTDVQLVITVGTVGGASVVGYVIAEFSIEKRRLEALADDWADGGRLDLILDIIAADTTTDIPATIATLDGKLDTIDNFLDTEIAAILEDTGTTLDDLVDDLEGRLTAALATALIAHSLGIGRVVVDAGSTTTAVVFELVNGAAASAVDDFYNGRVLVFTSGALTLQATSISDYVGATKTATVVALTGAPADDVTAVLV